MIPFATPRAAESRRARKMLAAGFLMLAFAKEGPGAQSSSATLTGIVVDQTGAVLADAAISVVNVDTSAERQTSSNNKGQFIVATLPPGRYTLFATVPGFQHTELRHIVLNVNDNISVRVTLHLVGVGEGVTVVAEAQRVSTLPSVSTVVDRQFVENLPLNGRSLHALLQLTPGVTFTSSGNSLEGGQFSVNGQRTNANYFTVDGVSANVGIGVTNPAQSGSGQLPALTALGGTNGLASVDALQEFRINTSTYAPEFGRAPGGQVALVTRSGTNFFRGSVFEYARHDALDATDWFTNKFGQPKPKMRQHNFGGVLGGPLVRKKAFFFLSYEGLRLDQPRSRVVTVPSQQVRQLALPAVQPFLNALPLPNGRNLGNGAAEFAASYSDPSRFDSTSVRIDYSAASRHTLFGRFSHTPSFTTVRAGSLSYTNTTNQRNTSFTTGATWIVSDRVVHDLRVNYTTNSAPYVQGLDSFGGAVVPPTSVFASGRSPVNGSVQFEVADSDSLWVWGMGTAFEQRQFNIIDSVTVTGRSHELKFGLDFRRINPSFSGGAGVAERFSLNVGDLSTGRIRRYSVTAFDTRPRAAAFDNLSLYAQDNWKLGGRVTLSYGLRWELVPPPRATEGDNAVTLENLDNPYGGQVRLAARETPLWKTRINNIAPRLGANYVLSTAPGAEMSIRGGFGTFHDLGYGQVATAYRTYPFIVSKFITTASLPLTPDVVAVPDLFGQPPVAIWAMDRRVELPFTYQWNVSFERALGTRQALTIGYIGADGQKLLKLDRYNISLLDWPAARTTVNVNRNRGYSNYHSFQVQFQRRLKNGLQSMASYTLGRSRDTASSDGAFNVPAERLPPALDYGDSDFDARHVFTTAVTYQTPASVSSSFWQGITQGWGVDLILRARSGVPLNLQTNVPFPPDTQTVRPDVVSGQPFWIGDSDAPGGRRLNRMAFEAPAAETQGDLPRGRVRGFNARQVDLAVRREFRITPPLRLQLRVEVFNLLNTPNFADPTGFLVDTPDFGTSRSMLNNSLGGLNALYQIGGPRSMQLAAKVLF